MNKNTKNAKIINSSDVVIKSKDNRKISTIAKVAEASVEGITTAKALKMLKSANTTIENKTKEKAKAFYAIKTKEENFMSWYEENQDDEKKIEGVKYNQAANLANMWAYVWCDEALNAYDSNKATLLTAYVRKDYAKIRALHDKGIINPAMRKNEITAILKKEFGDIQKDGKAAKAKTKDENGGNINEDIAVIEKVVQCYIKACKDEKTINKVNKAWDNILCELCK